jgi:ATP-dependent RNA helicase RhlB
VGKMNFLDLNLNEKLLKGIEKAGYVVCTPVQEKVLQSSYNGSDLYVQSQTGTGKTAAYLIAVIQEILGKVENNDKQVLILVPTRELAVQVEEEAKVLVGDSGLKILSVYGGVGYDNQISKIKNGTNIIIGTPGRIIDLNEGGNLSLKNCYFTVIDEADRMFDMGFYLDLRKILKELPETDNRQTMLFSATLNSYVKNLAWEYTREPIEITIDAENITVNEIDQELIHISSNEKMRLLVGILKKESPSSCIIFCNTKRMCEVVAKRLEINEIKCDFLIGDLPQQKRLAILKKVKNGEIKILVATDVAARGIDVDDLAMVINYDLPIEAENYIHRIGRTARAGKSGKAYTFCSEQDVYSLPAIERYVEMSIPSKVAIDDDLLEDKSANVYIKTENWHDDYDDNHGGYRKNNKNRNDNKYHDGKYKKDKHYDNKDKSDKFSNKNRSYNKYDNHSNKKYQKTDYSKKDNSLRKDNFDVEKLQSLSFDERMKLYKEKYEKTDKNASSNKSKNYSKNKNSNKKYENNKKYDYKNKNDNYKKYSKKSNTNYSKNKPEIKKTEIAKKEGIWSKIKSIFSK